MEGATVTPKYLERLQTNSHNTEVAQWAIEDLRKSGLSDEIINEAQLYLSQRQNLKESLVAHVGYKSNDGQTYAQSNHWYFFGYPQENYLRAKLKNPIDNQKYLAPFQQQPRFYYLPKEAKKLTKSTTKVVITEGEKKALKLTQELRKIGNDFVVVGLSGVTNYFSSLKPENFRLANKEVYISFDADSFTNPDVAKQLLKLFIYIWSKKATPKIAFWDKNKGKGIDDYLVAVEREGQNPATTLQRLIEDAKENIFELHSFRIEDIAKYCVDIDVNLEEPEIKILYSKFQLKKHIAGITQADLVNLAQKERKAELKDHIKETGFNGLIEEKGGVYRICEGKKGIYKKEIADFTMRFTKEITMIDDEENEVYEVTVKRGKKRKVFTIPADQITEVSTFRKAIAKKILAAYNITSTQEHNEFWRFIEYLSLEDMKICKKTNFVGLIDNKTFLTGKNIARAGKIEPLGEYVSTLKSKTEITETPFDLKSPVEWIEEIIPNQSWKAFGQSVNGIFANRLYDEANLNIPIINLDGQSETGKGTIARFMRALFGVHNDNNTYHNLAAKSTAVARRRSASKYKGCPIHIDEYTPSTKTNLELCSLWDRASTIQGAYTNDNETKETEVNAWFILAGTNSISGEKAEDVNTRLLHIDMNKRQHNPEVIGKIQDNLDSLSWFVPFVLEHLPFEKLVTSIRETIKVNRERLIEENKNVQERILVSYSMTQAAWNLLVEALGIEDKYGVNWGQIKHDIFEQDTTTKETDIARTFVSLIESELASGNEKIKNIALLQENGEQKFLTFQGLKTVLPQISKCAKQAGLPTTDSKTLGKALTRIGAEYKPVKNIFGFKQKKVWKIEVSEE